MYPSGIITRSIEVGPAFDLISGAPYGIRVMISPSRKILWNGNPLISSLQTFDIAPGVAGLISLPVSDQEGYENANGSEIVLQPGEYTHTYKIRVFYMLAGSVVRRNPESIFALPQGDGTPLDMDELIVAPGPTGGSPILVPDTWTQLLQDAQESAESAEAAALAAQEAVDAYLANPVDQELIEDAVDTYFVENPIDAVTPTQMAIAFESHENDPTPHVAYDAIPSLKILFENGLV